MNLLADVNVEKAVVDYLKESGHDVKWIPDYNCQMEDEQVLNLARSENRILITNDKDFGEIVFMQKGLAAGIVLLRVKGQRAGDKVGLLANLFERHADRLVGSFVVLSDEKVRILPLGEL